MKIFKNLPLQTLCCAVCLLLLSAGNVHAYLDPGSGSYMAQMLIASFLGVLFAFKSRVQAACRFILGLFSKNGKK